MGRDIIILCHCIMSITIGDVVLNYGYNKFGDIITSITVDPNGPLEPFIKQIKRILNISPITRGMADCGGNSEKICKKLKGIIEGTVGKIIITEWVKPINKTNNEIFDAVYGDMPFAIGGSYHALVYLEIIIEGIQYYIAIETTSCNLQFYVESNPERFEIMIKTRYQCREFKITDDCDKPWMDFISGGKQKVKRTIKNKKRKVKRTIKNKNRY